MRGAAVLVVLAVALVACGGVEVPDWYSMTEGERVGYCESLRAREDMADWRWSNDAALNARFQTLLGRCRQGGYL